MRALPVQPMAGRGRTAAAPVPVPTTAPEGPAAPTWLPGRAHIDGTSLLFVGYLVLIFLEFSGLPARFPLLKAMKLSTILSYSLLVLVVTRVGISDVIANRVAKILIGFLVLTWLSVFWAYIHTYAVASVRAIVDYLGLLIITSYMLDRKSRMDAFVATFAAVAFTLVGMNFEKLTAGGPRRGEFLAPYFMGDGNDLAWWLAIALPLIFSLTVGKHSWFYRIIGVVGAAACLLGVVGTQSRGAFLGIGAAFLYGWLFVSRKKIYGALMVAAVAVLMVVMAPAGYFERMNTVKDYETDNSAQARIQAWTAGLHMAMDHPMGVGAGNFPSVHGRFYMPDDDHNRVGWGGRRWANAHSIYFKVLGEYGFPGLALLLTAIVTLVIHNTASRRFIRAHPEGAPFTEYWPAFLNMSTLAYAMCGIFLGGFNYPHIFVLTGLCISVQRIIRLEWGGAATLPTRAGAAATLAGPKVRPSVVDAIARRS